MIEKRERASVFQLSLDYSMTIFLKNNQIETRFMRTHELLVEQMHCAIVDCEKTMDICPFSLRHPFRDQLFCFQRTTTRIRIDRLDTIRSNGMDMQYDAKCFCLLNSWKNTKNESVSLSHILLRSFPSLLIHCNDAFLLLSRWNLDDLSDSSTWLMHARRTEVVINH